MATTAQDKRRDLTSGTISRTLLLFALPTLASNILQSLNGSINSIWVGRFLGEGALAATANANLIMFLLFSAVFGFGMAATVMVGQAVGRRDLNAARVAFGSALGFCFLLSLIVATVGWITAPAILTALATPGPAYDFALIYLRVIFLAMPASLMSVMIMMGLRGAGDSITPLWFMILSVILDSGLNPVFILGVGPVPAMGIAGSAAATAVAGYVSLAALLVYVYRKDLPLRLRGRELAYLFPSAAQLKIIITKGFPMGLQMIVISTAGLIMIGLVNREGLLTSAAYGAAQQLWTYLQMPAMAIGAAASAMAAQNIGAGRWDRVNGIASRGMAFNVLMTGSLIILMLAFDRPALALFLGSGSPAIDLARHMQFLASWSFLLFGLTMVLFGTMRANGVVFTPLLILIAALYPVRLGFYHLAYPTLGADAIWLSFPVGSITSFILAGIYYLQGSWRATKLLVPPDEEECREQTNAATEPTGRMAPTG
ncbi:MAG: MATE family efflux transporter [Sphingobium sp.]|uniref:MATE family efflux transporter n=1 Tax=Sphingobium sp. TaxID=1912891 RepID=UPI0029AD7EFA|nr:MATE family efflux transporter [Sphingobium sp.]MDX3910198.1 MATE family efflux transporter [Sphingobium sp.]